MDESVIKEFEQQQVGTLKLSAAIRIGAQLRPQCVGYLFFEGASCALGAAWEGLGNAPVEPDSAGYGAVYDALEERYGEHVTSAVFIRNDDKGWSREQIAGWLESQGL